MEKKSIEVGFLLVFPIFFWRKLLLMSCSHVFTKNGTKYLFGTQSDSSCIIARARLLFYYKFIIITMATSSKEVGKETDIKEKVILEEEASWAKLCSKLVSIIYIF